MPAGGVGAAVGVSGAALVAVAAEVVVGVVGVGGVGVEAGVGVVAEVVEAIVGMEGVVISAEAPSNVLIEVLTVIGAGGMDAVFAAIGVPVAVVGARANVGHGV